MFPAGDFQILIATRNAGKIREVQEALHSLPVRLRYLQEFPHVCTVKETGTTYQENAVLKALNYAEQTALCAVADDSGLEVDALGGNPGVDSAEFGGKDIAQQERNQRILEAIPLHTSTGRNARFVCAIALAGWHQREGFHGTPQVLTVTEAHCEGTIALEPRGSNGFGFDPLFVPEGYLKTFAELPTKVKNTISHRAKALAAFRAFLGSWLQQT